MTQAITSARLGNQDVASVILGQSPPSSAYNEAGDGLPFFQGKVDFGLIHPTPRVWCNAGRKFATAGDILISVRAPVGDVNVARDHCAIGRGVAAIRPGPLSDPWFLYFALLYAKPVLERMATGSTFASVNRTTLNDLDIPFLDKSEQAEIGLFLRSLVYQIEQEEQALHTAQALKRAAMHTLFTRGLRGEAQKETEIGPLPESWGVVRVEEHAKTLSKGSSPKWQGFDYVKDGILFVRSQNVGNGVMEWQDKTFLPPAWNEQERRSVLQSGDVLVNLVGASIGRSAVGGPEIEGANCNQAVCFVRLIQNEVIPGFLNGFLLTPQGQAQIHGKKKDIARANLSLQDVRNVLMPKPPINEQRDTVAILDAIDRKIDLRRRKRVLLEELFKALLHKLMTGEIRVGELWTSSEVQVHRPGYWQQGNCK